jgi:mannose-6-phosphate isomerase
MDLPLRFDPFLRPMVWGGRALEKCLGKRLPTSDSYGESWEVSDHPVHRSLVAAGPRAGQSLRVLMEQETGGLLGGAAIRFKTFPWLFKFLDAGDWLSVQVHPDEKSVGKLWPGEGSKTEAWLVLRAEPGSRIYAGLLPGVNEPQLRRAIQDGTVVDCLHVIQPDPGDCIFLPAGTVHAVGGGVLLAEIQETSDATFRIFDWNRRDSHDKSRPLHVEEALASIHWDQGQVHPIRCGGFPGSKAPPPASRRHRQELVACPSFDVGYVRAGEPFACAGENTLELLAILDGKGQIVTPRSEELIERGQVWLLPAAMPRSWCRPDGIIHALHCTLP